MDDAHGGRGKSFPSVVEWHGLGILKLRQVRSVLAVSAAVAATELMPRAVVGRSLNRQSGNPGCCFRLLNRPSEGIMLPNPSSCTHTGEIGHQTVCRQNRCRWILQRMASDLALQNR